MNQQINDLLNKLDRLTIGCAINDQGLTYHHQHTQLIYSNNTLSESDQLNEICQKLEDLSIETTSSNSGLLMIFHT